MFNSTYEHATSSSQLPIPATPLIGRHGEIESILALIQRVKPRLLTFTGAPGVGKTRLCLHIANQLAPQFVDGIHFVALAPVQDANQVTNAITRALGLQATLTTDAPDPLRLALRQQQALLILDNFEHVMAAAPLVADLLRSAPHVTIFVTSRLALRLSSEQEYPVPPLGLPNEGLQDSAASLRSPSVELFITRAQAVKVGFQFAPLDVAIVANICRRLDGIPLAIELAATRSKVLPLPALLARLSNRLATLTQGARDLPQRQQTLRAAITWSYDLLTPTQQTLLRRLSVFVGGWTLEAAEAIQPVSLTGDTVLDDLAALLDHSLIQSISSATSEPRYTMLEMISEFASEQLVQTGEEVQVRQLHAEYYLSMVQQIPLELETPVQTWYDQLDLEFNNLRSALHWAYTNRSQPLFVNAVMALSRFWWERGYLKESWDWLHIALDLELEPFAIHAEDYRRAPFALPPTPARAGLLYQVAFDYWVAGQWDDAIAIGEQSLALYQALDNRRGESWVTRLLGVVFEEQGQWVRAQAMGEASLRLCQELEDRAGTGFAALILGKVYFHIGDEPNSTQMLRQCEAIFRQIGQIEGLFFYLRMSAELALQRGDAVGAIVKLEESIALARQIDHKAGIGMGLLILAVAQLQVQEWQAAALTTHETLTVLQKIGVRNGMSSCYAILAKLADTLKLYTEALCFWQTSETFRLQNKMLPARHSVVEELRFALIDQFNHPRYLVLQNTTTLPTLNSAIVTLDRVLEGQPRPVHPKTTLSTTSDAAPLHVHTLLMHTSSGHSYELTTRERDVLSLLTQGLTYNAIAEKLVVSPRTVDAHLRAIYAKLGVNSRHEAARLARQQLLV